MSIFHLLNVTKFQKFVQQFPQPLFDAVIKQYSKIFDQSPASIWYDKFEIPIKP